MSGCFRFMAKFKFDGVDEYVSKLVSLSKVSEGMIKRAVFEGAKIVGDDILDAIRALPETGAGYPKRGYFPTEMVKGVTADQKEGLIKGFGYAKMRNDGGYINTKIGFDGYNNTVTDKFPSGQPNMLIARSVESGSSKRVKTPFVRPAIQRAKERAEMAMSASVDKDINTTMEGK